MLTVTHGSVQVSQQDVAELIQATELTNIRLDEIQAGPVQDLAEDMRAEVQALTPGFAVIPDSDVILVRLQHDIRFTPNAIPAGESAEPTLLSLAHIVQFQVTKEIEATEAAISAWIETNVYFIAYPYVRQAVSQITTALGMPPVVLGYLKRSERPFSSSDPEESSASNGDANL